MRKSTTTGAAVHRSSRFVAPWICGPSAKRSRRCRRYFQMKSTSVTSTSRKIAMTKIETKRKLSRIPSALGDSASTGAKPPSCASARGATTAPSSRTTPNTRSRRTGCHSMKVPQDPARRTRVRLPGDVMRPFQVFLNGVEQEEGADFRVEGRTLVFERELKTEGKLGFWRWLSLWVGIAGTYRQNDSVDVVYQRNGKPVV